MADVEAAGDADPGWRRRQRIAEVFGDDLPATTTDERSGPPSSGRSREWYERNRPPHHG